MKKRRVYKSPGPGEWMRPSRRGFRLGCCDCGLVHVVDHELRGAKRKVIMWRFFRDERATAAMRKGKK